VRRAVLIHNAACAAEQTDAGSPPSMPLRLLRRSHRALHGVPLTFPSTFQELPMNTQRVAAGVLLALAAAAAQAETFDLSAGPYSANVDKTGTAEFSDVYNFSFNGAAGFVSGSIIEYRLSNAIDIDWGDVPAVAIYGGWGATGPLLASYGDPMTPTGSFAIEDLVVPNQFSVAINGRAVGTGLSVFQPGIHGSYDLSIAAQPVPEPGSYALMLAGLGAIGFLGVRRRNER
jgi:hypothetical protein